MPESRENKPRRTGTIEEHQHGHWFLYVTEWTDATEGRRHRELEIYYAKAHPIWNTTDPSKFEAAKKLFFLAPESFQGHPEGELPVLPDELCEACEGCGQVANDEDSTPWIFWEKLRKLNNTVVRDNMVRPLKCEACGGTGKVPRMKWSEHNIVPDGDRFWCKNCEVHFAPGEIHFGVSVVHPSAMIEVELCAQCGKPLGPDHECLPRGRKREIDGSLRSEKAGVGISDESEAKGSR